MPRAEEDPSTGENGRPAVDTVAGSRIGFVAAALVAVAGLLVAGFCTLRWALIEVPITSESHIAEYAEAYTSASPAALILDFEEMEERGIDMPVLYNYKRIEVTKQTWGRNAMISGVSALAFLILAMLLSKSRGKTSQI